MSKNETRLPKKGGAKRVSEAFKKIIERPLPQELFDMVDDIYERRKKEEQERNKKVAKPQAKKEAEI